MKKRLTKCEGILAMYVTDRELIFRIYKELFFFKVKKINEPIRNWARDLKQRILDR